MKKKLIACSAALVLSFAVCCGVFQYFHPTHIKFNDRFVIGNTIDEIVKKYGEPYSVDSDYMTYQIRGNTPELIMSYDNSLWYVIVLKHGVAESVYLREGYIGG